MQRDLATLPLPQHVRFKLRSAGFTTAEDLMKIDPVELAKEAQLTPEEALEVLELVSVENGENTNHDSVRSISAFDLLVEENSKPPIPTFCQAIDALLGGGIPLKKVTELCGMPGAGKTQLCIQLSINVQIPSECGGLDGEAVYIDTEGSFTVDRLMQIAESTVNTCRKIMNTSNEFSLTDLFTVGKLLEGVHYFHCKNSIELMAVVNTLPEFLQLHPKIRLLIVDSICFHFRYGFDDNYMVRTKILNGLSQLLVKIAQEFDMAVLVTNQMTTKVQENDTSYLIPALGKSWGHACTIRMILSWEEQKRQATLLKSPWRQEAVAIYQITPGGIRDCPNEMSNNESSSSSSTDTLQQNKRPKIDV